MALSKTHNLLTCSDWTGASLRDVLENELTPYRSGADQICLDGAIPQDGDKQALTVSVRNESNLTVYTATLTFAGVWTGENVPLPREPFD